MENPSSKNNRANVSALVRVGDKAVMIDCGKTARQVCMRHFPKLGVRNVNAIVLTHGHADAILGLDDARDIQEDGVKVEVNGKIEYRYGPPLPIWLNEETMETCKSVFPYLIPAEVKEKDGKKDIPRRVARLKWNVYREKDYFRPFYPVPDGEIEFIPFPMLHGGTYVCMGFLITIKDRFVVAFLSDAHCLPERTWTFLEKQSRIDLLVVDLLTRSSYHGSHFNMHQSIDVVRRLQPVKAIAVGMTCSLGMHDEVNEELAKLDGEGLNFRLSYDGMRFPCS